MIHAHTSAARHRRHLAFVTASLMLACLFITLFWRMDSLPAMFSAQAMGSVSDGGAAVHQKNNFQALRRVRPPVSARSIRMTAPGRSVAVRRVAGAMGPAVVHFVSEKTVHVAAWHRPAPVKKIAWHRPTPARPTFLHIRWYHGRKFVYWKTLRMRVTSYAPDRRCCYPFNGTVTASGKSVTTNGGHLVAADTNIVPFNDLITIPGYAGDQPVPVLDRGGAIKGNRLDVLRPTFAAARQWGSRILFVRIFRPATAQ